MCLQFFKLQNPCTHNRDKQNVEKISSKTKNLKIEEIVALPTPPLLVDAYGAEIVVIYHMWSLLPEYDEKVRFD